MTLSGNELRRSPASPRRPVMRAGTRGRSDGAGAGPPPNRASSRTSRASRAALIRREAIPPDSKATVYRLPTAIKSEAPIPGVGETVLPWNVIRKRRCKCQATTRSHPSRGRSAPLRRGGRKALTLPLETIDATTGSTGFHGSSESQAADSLSPF